LTEFVCLSTEFLWNARFKVPVAAILHLPGAPTPLSEGRPGRASHGSPRAAAQAGTNSVPLPVISNPPQAGGMGQARGRVRNLFRRSNPNSFLTRPCQPWLSLTVHSPDGRNAHPA
jgi:hypothetical protein